MSLYGAWFKKPKERARFEARICQYLSTFVFFQVALIPHDFRQFRHKIGIDQTQLGLAVGRYFNDRARLKRDHNMKDLLHRSKMAAYTVKWVLHHAPIYSTLTVEEMKRLPKHIATEVINANYLFAVQIIFDALPELDRRDFKKGGRYCHVLRDLLYYMQTDAYNEKMAAALFHALSIGCEQVSANGVA